LSKNSTNSVSDQPPVETAVERWLLESQSVSEIRQALAQLYPTADANKVLKSVTTNFAKLSRAPFEALLGWCLSSTRDIHRRAIETGDYALALSAVKQVCALAKEAARNSQKQQDTIYLD